MFGYALWKAGEDLVFRLRANASNKTLLNSSWSRTLYSVVLSDNLLYFFLCVQASPDTVLPNHSRAYLSIACILTFNNLMVVGVTHIPWFSYGSVIMFKLCS